MTTSIEPFYEALGRRIRACRENAKLTQTELAERLTPRLTRASIANIENAKQRVLAHMLVDIASALTVSVVDLLPPGNVVAGETSPTIAPSIVAELEQELGPEGGEALIAELRAVRGRAAP